MNTDLARRIGFTLGALFVYRIGCHLPIPGIDGQIFSELFQARGGFFGPAGGTVAQLSLFALGIIPYFTASLLLQIVILASSRVRAVADRGEQGRRTIEKATLVLTVLIAAFQAYGIATAMEAVPRLVTTPGPSFRITMVATLCAGSVLLAWLADKITTRGFGNGIALLLFSAAVIEIPQHIAGIAQMIQGGLLSAPGGAILLLLSLAMIAFVAAVEGARREFYVTRADGHGSSILSFKVNPAGIVPQLFAGWLVLLPTTLLPLAWSLVDAEQAGRMARLLQLPSPWFWLAFALCLIVAAFVYTAFLLYPTRIAERLQAFGLRLSGVEPGEPTAQALDHSISRLALAGAGYLVLVIVGTQVLSLLLRLPFVFGGFALLVVVCTVLDLKAQFEASRIAIGGKCS